MDVLDFVHFFQSQKKPFSLTENATFGAFKADLYAERRFNMLGRDHFFVHLGTEISFHESYCRAAHEAARKHVSASYKLPRALRFVVPHVVSVFASSDGFCQQSLSLTSLSGRNALGGEVFSVFFIDMNTRKWYGPDYHTVEADGIRMQLKKTDPTNRGIELIRQLMGV